MNPFQDIVEIAEGRAGGSSHDRADALLDRVRRAVDLGATRVQLLSLAGHGGRDWVAWALDEASRTAAH